MSATGHIHNTAALTHRHYYDSAQARGNERRTWWVVALTASMMVLEIVCGGLFHSMALMADGWHMSTHAGALAIVGFAYFFARTHASNPSFTFGTGKINALGGYTSAVMLAMVALWVLGESVSRLFSPVTIHFNEAIVISLIGLAVNLVSARLLVGHPHGHAHAHNHTHGHDDHDHHHDHNIRSAYLHVLADSVLSILTVIALVMVKFVGWMWLDPVMGMVGSLVIAHWAFGLMRQSSLILLDHADSAMGEEVRRSIEGDADNKITDLHVWQLAPGKHSAIISLVTDMPRPPAHYKQLLTGIHGIVHVTVEVNRCESG